MNGIAAADLRRIGAAGPDLAALATAAEEELAALGLADRAQVFQAATAAVLAGAAAPAIGAPLVLLDLAVTCRVELALLAALAERSGDVLATVPLGDASSRSRLERALGCGAEPLAARGPGSALGRLQQHLFAASVPEPAALDPSVTLRGWPGMARECVEIARQIQAEAGRGVPFDRIAVFLHAAGDYAVQLDEAFQRAAIPACFARGTTRPHAAGRALLALLACASERLSARRFAEYLSLAQVPDPAADRRCGLRAAARRAAAARRRRRGGRGRFRAARRRRHPARPRPRRSARRQRARTVALGAATGRCRGDRRRRALGAPARRPAQRDRGAASRARAGRRGSARVQRAPRRRPRAPARIRAAADRTARHAARERAVVGLARGAARARARGAA